MYFVSVVCVYECATCASAIAFVLCYLCKMCEVIYVWTKLLMCPLNVVIVVVIVILKIIFAHIYVLIVHAQNVSTR